MHAAAVRARRISAALVMLALVVCLQGCAALLIAGGAAAVMSATDRRTAGAQLDDQNVELKAGAAISSDPMLKDVHVSITSFNGLVLLSGETPTVEQRDKVLTAVRAVPGARRTVNELRIAPPSETSRRTNDTWLTGKVKTKLIGVDQLDSAHVKVITENAVVYLMGLVKRQEAELAAQATSEVGGVERVVKLFEYLD